LGEVEEKRVVTLFTNNNYSLKTNERLVILSEVGSTRGAIASRFTGPKSCMGNNKG